MDVVIYHNPACGTSRNTLAMIRQSGIEPHVVEYLKTPPSRDMLRALLRRKGTPYEELGLDKADLSDDDLLDAMVRQPILIERPIVATPLGVRLCRPSETVLEILPPLSGEFVKEDGEQVLDEHGRRVRRA
jgi:arsenate reductase